MASSDKEERRRRIMERGSDRIALITGQIRTLETSSLPSSSTSSYSGHEHSDPSPSVANLPNDRAPIDYDVSGASGILRQKTSSNEVSGGNSLGIEPEPNFQNSLTAPASGSITKTQKTRIRKASSSKQPKFFSSKSLNACIIASERTRAICSLAIASLVVLSYIDYPLFGINIVNSDSYIVGKPVYTILLTDITIVLGRLFREKGDGFEEEAEDEKLMSGSKKKEDEQNWDGAVKLLERSLVAYQAFRGIFIDLSIYLVVVISGLSLM